MPACSLSATPGPEPSGSSSTQREPIEQLRIAVLGNGARELVVVGLTVPAGALGLRAEPPRVAQAIEDRVAQAIVLEQAVHHAAHHVAAGIARAVDGALARLALAWAG